MWEVFSNREIAIAIWLLIFAPFVLKRKSVRESLIGLIKAIFARQILLPLILMGFYVAGIVIVLFRFDLWTIYLLKDTVFWFCFVAVLVMYRFVAAKGGNLPIRESILDNLKIVVLLEFLVNTYMFSLAIELVVVPIVSVIAIVNALAEVRKQHRPVAKLTGGILAIIGIVTILYALVNTVSDYRTLGTVDTVRSFVLPILLCIALLPFVYLLALYTSYESLFIGFRLGNKKSAEIIKYAKWSIFTHCFLSIKQVSRLKPYDLMHLQSTADVDRLFNRTYSCVD